MQHPLCAHSPNVSNCCEAKRNAGFASHHTAEAYVAVWLNHVVKLLL